MKPDTPLHHPNYALLIFPAIFLFILPFTGTVALRLLTLAITLGLAIWYWHRQPRPPLPLKVPIFAWAGLACTSLLWTVNFDATLKEIRHEILFAIIAFFSFFILTRSKRELIFFVSAIAISSAVMSGLALCSWLPNHIWDPNGRQGGVGTYSTHTLLVLSWLTLALIIINKNGSRLAFIALIACTITTSYLTLSRMFWPALIIQISAFALFLLWGQRKQLSIRTILGIKLGVIIIITVLLWGLINSFDKKTHIQIDSLADAYDIMEYDPRLALWQQAHEYIQKRPLLGMGLGREIATKTPEQLDPATQKDAWPSNLGHAHNTFINYAVQLGIIGVIALTFLFGSLIWTFFKHSQDPDRDIRMLAICMLALILGFIAKNMTDDFFRRDLSLLFWASMGMSLGYIHWHKFREKRQNEGETKPGDAAH